MAVITTWGAILENVCGSDHYLGRDIRECLAVGRDIRECLWQ